MLKLLLFIGWTAFMYYKHETIKRWKESKLDPEIVNLKKTILGWLGKDQ